MKIGKNLITSLALILVLVLAMGCKAGVSGEVYDNEVPEVEENTDDKSENIVLPVNEELSRVKIEMEDGGVMIFELYPQYAPETVVNFLELVESGFYDGLKFHRIMKGFMAQSGDPLGTGMGGSDKTIKGEFAENGFEQNTLKHVKGVLSMARSNDPDSASSQFFLMDGDAPNLDGLYAAFGMLVEGEDVLDKITATEVEKSLQGEMSLPTTDVIIKSITIQ